MRRFRWSLPMALVLTACAAPPREQPPPVVARPAAPAPSAADWEVVESRLAVRVYRDGPMQRLGHDHLVTSESVAGRIALGEPLAKSSFVLTLPLDSLVVDDEAARAAAGGIFAAPVPDRDREATRRNLLGDKVLDAATQDTVRMTSESVTGGPSRYEARVRLSFAGRERTVSAPFTVAVRGDRLEAHADFRLTHADLGLEPFSVALGALRVREDFDVDLTLEARRGT